MRSPPYWLYVLILMGAPLAGERTLADRDASPGAVADRGTVPGLTIIMVPVAAVPPIIADLGVLRT